jgi:hypothetical protein
MMSASMESKGSCNPNSINFKFSHFISVFQETHQSSLFCRRRRERGGGQREGLKGLSYSSYQLFVRIVFEDIVVVL